MGIREEYRDALLPRFAGREALPLEEWHRRFAPEVDRAALGELFDEVESSYRIAPGLLRPDDSLALLSEPPPSNGAWQRFRFWGIARDLTRNIGDELMERALRRKPGEDNFLYNFGELVRAWCGVASDGSDKSATSSVLGR